ncbi:MAG: 1-deoxy-D-xylulose-5-phosphate reductoisomerase [Bacteroidia bacterium]|nr:1-deoxy-D-xylulose-5-phosphate reductoisomerase [Bacteroidia bacterium]GIV22820.1 MAG: 1-deoxy-D-xylulose 5-phosphate reductoisomerase [Bacteroidia bacterium]
MQAVTVLGASGSIGQQALSLIAAYPDKYRLWGLSLHQQTHLLPELIEKFQPAWVAVTHPEAFAKVRSQWNASIPLFSAQDLYTTLQEAPGDTVLNGIVGAAGFWASWATLKHPTARLALANKESLVFGGLWLSTYRDRILPVDSEHSAIFQCLQGEAPESVEQLILTASGGPFRGRSAESLLHVHPTEALRHPVWQMGHRITIDSATLMNKALELIEAHWLFGLPEEAITVWIHPQCIVHSLVLFRDGSMKAQLSQPDMRLPILYALSYPERLPFSEGRCALPLLGSLTFQEVDTATFPSIELARLALRKGGSAPALLNAADEIAVEAFLQEKIGFLDIFEWVEWALFQPEADIVPDSPETLAAIEREVRQRLRAEIGMPAHAR